MKLHEDIKVFQDTNMNYCKEIKNCWNSGGKGLSEQQNLLLKTIRITYYVINLHNM